MYSSPLFLVFCALYFKMFNQNELTTLLHGKAVVNSRVSVKQSTWHLCLTPQLLKLTFSEHSLSDFSHPLIYFLLCSIDRVAIVHQSASYVFLSFCPCLFVHFFSSWSMIFLLYILLCVFIFILTAALAKPKLAVTFAILMWLSWDDTRWQSRMLKSRLHGRLPRLFMVRCSTYWAI